MDLKTNIWTITPRTRRKWNKKVLAKLDFFWCWSRRESGKRRNIEIMYDVWVHHFHYFLTKEYFPFFLFTTLHSNNSSTLTATTCFTNSAKPFKDQNIDLYENEKKRIWGTHKKNRLSWAERNWVSCFL